MTTDPLVHCSTPNCGEVLYLSETVKGSTIARNLEGRFCATCAGEHRRVVKSEEYRLEVLLTEAGLLPPDQRVVISATRRKKVHHFEGQGSLL